MWNSQNEQTTAVPIPPQVLEQLADLSAIGATDMRDYRAVILCASICGYREAVVWVANNRNRLAEAVQASRGYSRVK